MTVYFAWHKFPPSLESIRWSEADIQSYIVLKLRDWLGDRPGLFLFEGSLEGNKMNKRAAAKAKALGMEKGVPDIRLHLPGGRLISIELKRRNGSVSREQKDRHAVLKKLGFEVLVIKAKTPADGWVQVITITRKYGL